MINEEIEGAQVTELWLVSDLIPYEKNAKKHPEEQIEKIANSMREHGWNGSPIEITETGLIVNGHGRRLAAMKLNWKKVPVVILSHIKTDEQIRKYRLDDNETAKSDWDTELLTEELQWLNSQGVDLSTTFDIRELDFALEDLGEINLDAINPDIGSQVEEQTGKTNDKIKDEDSREVPISKIIGTSSLSGESRRIFSRFILFSEQRTSLEGIEALIEYMRKEMEDND